MRVELFADPFTPPAFIDVHVAMTVTQILAHPEIQAPPEFFEIGVIKINGKILRREMWPHTKVKPARVALVELVPVPQGRNLLSTLATIATIAAVAAIGAFGLPFLGIAAGTFGASLAAAGVGLLGQLAARALTAPPELGNESAQKSQVQAGISSNAPVLNDMLPVVLGKIGFSPPPLMPPYTVFTQDQTSIEGVLGLQGRNLVENVKINGLASSEIPGLQLEIFEGSMGDADRTIATKTVLEQRLGLVLSEFKTVALNDYGDLLKPEPPSPVAQWHSFKTTGQSDKFILQLLLPSGAVKTDSGDTAMVPVRIQIRKVGDTTWRALPTCHIADYKKGTGPVRAQVALHWQKMPGGRHYVSARGQFPIFDLIAATGRGQWFEYNSDAYFRGVGGSLLATNLWNTYTNPIMTGSTTSGVTISASSFWAAGQEAWRAADSTTTTSYWTSASGDAVPWWKIDFGSPTLVKSYSFTFDNSGRSAWIPTEFYLEGSLDNVNWVKLDDVNLKSGALQSSAIQGTDYQITSPDSFRYYRFTFLDNNNISDTVISIGDVRFYPHDLLGCRGGSGSDGSFAQFTSPSVAPRCMYGSLDENGANFYLDPNQWPPGEYEGRIMRGWAQLESWFVPETYSFHDAETNHSYYFEYGTNPDGTKVIYQGQKNFKSDLQVELVQTHRADAPFNPVGRTMIAFSAPDIQIDSIYAEFTRYAPIWDAANQIWTEQEYPTKNPAALYRQILLGGANASPTPGEVIDEDELAAWYEHCEAIGYECNAVVQGSRVQEALQLLASAGYASPRSGATYGVVQEKDTSAELAKVAITPLNSRDLGTSIAYAKVPDAIRANFADETDSYMQNSVTVYRTGKDANTAKLFEEISYSGFTNAAKAAARAQFDLDQSHARQVRYLREVGVQGIVMKRGDVVKINDDVLDRNQASGWITSVQRSGGFIASVTLDNIIPWSKRSEIEGVEDVTSLTDILNPDQPMGLCFGHKPDTEYEVSNVTDSNVCTFVTPIADDPEITEDLQVLCGNMTNTGRRAIIMSWQPTGFETFKIELADEANELFA